MNKRRSTAPKSRALKVLLASVPFAPSIGGIETVSAALAEELTLLGCEVVVVTRTATVDHHRRAYRVVRRANALQLFKLVLWSDVVFHNNINLRNAWPLAVVRRPWVVAHHMWLPQAGSKSISGYLKRLALKWIDRHIAVSSVMAADIGAPTTVIPNPYDSARFRVLPYMARERDIIFVGRLVSDKGVGLLIEALAMLKARGRTARLTIVGRGPEEDTLRKQVTALGLEPQVEFAGSRVGDALIKLLNAHRLIAVPSVWREPFGVVALEGIACGCIPVVADGGGLEEAIGSCGLVFKRGDRADLSSKLELALTDEAVQQRFNAHAAAHLLKHQKAAIAERYRRVLVDAVHGNPAEGSGGDKVHASAGMSGSSR